MIRALLLKLMYRLVQWEVRSVSTKSGKDIPGTRVFKGSYREARRYYKGDYPKAQHELRLQAVIVAADKWNPGEIRHSEFSYAEADAAKTATGYPSGHTMSSDGIYTKEVSSEDMDGMKLTVRVTGDFPDDMEVPDDISINKPQDPDAFVPYAGEEYGDHDCDSDGPLEWSESEAGYLPSCSICGHVTTEEPA